MIGRGQAYKPCLSAGWLAVLDEAVQVQVTTRGRASGEGDVGRRDPRTIWLLLKREKVLMDESRAGLVLCGDGSVANRHEVAASLLLQHPVVRDAMGNCTFSSSSCLLMIPSAATVELSKLPFVILSQTRRACARG